MLAATTPYKAPHQDKVVAEDPGSPAVQDQKVQDQQVQDQQDQDQQAQDQQV